VDLALSEATDSLFQDKESDNILVTVTPQGKRIDKEGVFFKTPLLM